MLFECLTLERPFGGPNQAALARAITTRQPPPLSRYGAGYPAALDAIVQTALEKEPDRRYASVAQLAADLRARRDQRPVSVKPLNRVQRVARWVRLHRAMATVSGLLFAAVVGIAAVSWYLMSVRSASATGRTRALKFMEALWGPRHLGNDWGAGQPTEELASRWRALEARVRSLIVDWKRDQE